MKKLDLKYINIVLGVALFALVLFVPVWKIDIFSSGAVMIDVTSYCSIADQLTNGFFVIKIADGLNYLFSEGTFETVIAILSLVLGIIFINKKKLFGLGVVMFIVCLLTLFVFGSISIAVVETETIYYQGSVRYYGNNFLALLAFIPFMSLVSAVAYKNNMKKEIVVKESKIKLNHQQKIVFSSVAVIVVLIVSVMFYQNYFIVNYTEGVYTSDNVKNVDENSNVEEVEFIVKEVVGCKYAVEFDSTGDWDAKGVMHACFFDEPCYQLTLREKVDGEWISYVMHSFDNDNMEMILSDMEQGLEFQVYAKRTSFPFFSNMNGLNIEVYKGNQFGDSDDYKRVYTAKLR